MEYWYATLKRYWLHFIAIGLLAICLRRYVALAQWEEKLPEMAVAVFGCVCVLASDEVVDWTGSYGLTRNQWRSYPTWFVRNTGICLLLYAVWGL
ncbi:MAG: hypothetical protein KDA42_15065 [Planctomycetales bacterium]|nr:hypothetical protein [Planctomycetales bacterium]